MKTDQFHHRYVSGIPTLEFAVPKGELLQLELDFHSFSPPTDGANINKAINVCACESLANYNLESPYNTEGSCIKRSPPDSDTLDLTTCSADVTEGCIDGIQDLYHVSYSSDLD